MICTNRDAIYKNHNALLRIIIAPDLFVSASVNKCGRKYHKLFGSYRFAWKFSKSGATRGRAKEKLSLASLTWKLKGQYLCDVVAFFLRLHEKSLQTSEGSESFSQKVF